MEDLGSTTVMKLRGDENWANWKFQVRLVLLDKGLLDIVTQGQGIGKFKSRPSCQQMKAQILQEISSLNVSAVTVVFEIY